MQERYEVCVVSPNTYFAMTPLLAQAATGTLEVSTEQRGHSESGSWRRP